ncbi:phenoloxidase-activating factor 3 isoform X1 [Procambarus clarkii]|uniref:phenoloxidase-activating factor 3 isoform X1 n=2 Tax=Procambarus clarkii TaxID=6728 RepID=UPI00374433AA
MAQGVIMGRFTAMMMMVTAMVTVGCDAQQGASCTARGRRGVCGPIINCPALLTLLNLIKAGRAPPQAVDTLRSAICGFDNNFPLVCCSSPGAAAPGPGNLVKPVLPTSCGVSALTDRIIDGHDAPLLAWPWMALLRGRFKGQLTWFCGGVLISDRYVLTAAHCFKSNLLTLESVRIGEHTLNQDRDCEKGICAPLPQDIPVAQVINHPEYGKPCPECNDIALLRLAHPATMNPLHVVPICLPLNPQKDLGFSEQQFIGKSAWAAGWGTTSRDSSEFIRLNPLQQVQLPIQNSQYCETLRQGYPDRRMVLCAGGEGKDTCRGDSGGPLAFTNTGGTRHFVVGITSRGPRECGSTNTQGLYTNVAFYASWITNNLKP